MGQLRCVLDSELSAVSVIQLSIAFFDTLFMTTVSLSNCPLFELFLTPQAVSIPEEIFHWRENISYGACRVRFRIGSRRPGTLF